MGGRYIRVHTSVGFTLFPHTHIYNSHVTSIPKLKNEKKKNCRRDECVFHQAGSKRGEKKNTVRFLNSRLGERTIRRGRQPAAASSRARLIPSFDPTISSERVWHAGRILTLGLSPRRLVLPALPPAFNNSFINYHPFIHSSIPPVIHSFIHSFILFHFEFFCHLAPKCNGWFFGCGMHRAHFTRSSVVVVVLVCMYFIRLHTRTRRRHIHRHTSLPPPYISARYSSSFPASSYVTI